MACMRLPRLACAALGLAGLFGCGGDDNTVPANDASADSLQGTVASDAGPHDARPHSGDAAGGGASSRRAVIALYSLIDGFSVGQVALDVRDGCSRVTEGDCWLQRCPGSSTASYPRSGDLTVGIADATFTFVQSTAGAFYSSQGALPPRLVGQELVTVMSRGDDIPAFATQARHPLLLLVDAPAPDTEGTITAGRTADLDLRFTRGVPGVEAIAAGQLGAWGLECRVPSERGRLRISRKLLEQAGPGRVSLLTSGRTTLRTGSWDVDLWLMGNAYKPDRTRPVVVEFK
jgi:hypothetical protein